MGFGATGHLVLDSSQGVSRWGSSEETVCSWAKGIKVASGPCRLGNERILQSEE